MNDSMVATWQAQGTPCLDNLLPPRDRTRSQLGGLIPDCDSAADTTEDSRRRELGAPVLHAPGH